MTTTNQVLSTTVTVMKYDSEKPLCFANVSNLHVQEGVIIITQVTLGTTTIFPISEVKMIEQVESVG